MIKEKKAKIMTECVPGPESLRLWEQASQYVPQGVSCGTRLFVREAKGALMEDVDGNVFVDFAAGIGMQNAGHCHDEVVEAVREQAGQFIHPCYHVAAYASYAELAERLCSRTPGRFSKKAMFANSGAEAVENAVKIARRHTGKTGIISLECAFHGRTYMAMTLTSKVVPYKYGFGPFQQDIWKIPSPYCYRCPFGSSRPNCGLACAEKLRTQLKGEWHPDMMAALIAEPVQGEGGFIVTPPGYLEALQDICRENGILFVADEIQTGFGRTGKLFASEHYAIAPDIMTLSKSLAAGLPLSAVVGHAEIMDTPFPGQLGGTYGGSPLACRAALKVLDILDEENLPDKAVQIGEAITGRLSAMQEKYEAIGDVRGLGAMVAVELVKDRESREPDADLTKKLIAYARQRGIILMSAGLFGNLIRFLPPLVMTLEQLHQGMDILEEALGAC